MKGKQLTEGSKIWNESGNTKHPYHPLDEFSREMVEAMACEIAKLRCCYYWEVQNGEFINGIIEEFKR